MKDTIKVIIFGILLIGGAITISNTHGDGYAHCPKCGKRIGVDCHFTEYDHGSSIIVLHESCWNSSTPSERVRLYIKFMDRYGWPEEKKIKVIQAALTEK